MAVHASHIIFFFGFVLLTKSLHAQFSGEDAVIKHLHPDAEQSLQTRSLFDSLSLGGLFESIVSNPSGFSNFANNFSDADQDFSNSVFDSGVGGTSNSFNNHGGGDQNFAGAVFNTGGTHGGTRDSFNNVGGGTQRFGKGAVFNLGVGTSGSFNNRRGGAQIGLDTTKFNTGPVTDSFNGLNFPPKFRTMNLGKNIHIESDGLVMRGLNADNAGVSMKGNKVFVCGKVVVDNITKITGEPSYQKSADGALWYTNAKIGEPMTPDEIKKFEADWAEHIKEQEARKAARQNRLKQAREDREKRYKRREEERAKRRQASRSSSSSWW